MQQIDLVGKRGVGKKMLVDDEDYPLLSQYRWWLKWNGRGPNMYPATYVRGHKNKVVVHRMLMSPPDGYEIDHIDGNELNNQRSNLRIVSRSQNNLNQHRKRTYRRMTSRYIGVCWGARERKWRATITIGGKQKYLGTYHNEFDAVNARALARERYATQTTQD